MAKSYAIDLNFTSYTPNPAISSTSLHTGPKYLTLSNPKALNQLSFQPIIPLPSPQKISRRKIDYLLQNIGLWPLHPSQIRNPYHPGINLNDGENRARYELKQHFKGFDPKHHSITGNTAGTLRIREQFAQFSFTAMKEAMQFDDENVERLFVRIFKGVGGGGKVKVWSSGRKMSLFSGWGRGDKFIGSVEAQVEDIFDNVHIWRQCQLFSSPWSESLAKRASNHFYLPSLPRKAKRTKKNIVASPKVITEKWRARRREQEKKAGRWLDGTMRMDRMWEEFHWVLDVEDPRKNIWSFEVDGKDIWHHKKH